MSGLAMRAFTAALDLAIDHEADANTCAQEVTRTNDLCLDRRLCANSPIRRSIRRSFSAITTAPGRRSKGRQEYPSGWPASQGIGIGHDAGVDVDRLKSQCRSPEDQTNGRGSRGGPERMRSKQCCERRRGAEAPPIAVSGQKK